MIEQKSWRRVASIGLVLAGAMAMYAVISDILRDTLVHLVHLLSTADNELSTTTPLWACFVYWCVFALLVTLTIYIAVLDFKYIRLKFALEKRKLMEQTLGDEEMQALLAKTRGDEGRDPS